MKCTNDKFKGRKFYFDYQFLPDKNRSKKLSKLPCNAACFFRVLNDKQWIQLLFKKPDHDMRLSFKLRCQRYQIYRDRKKSTKPSRYVNETSFPLNQDEICKQSAANDRKIAEKRSFAAEKS